jgi:16S rRNA processing protein RimM
MKLFSIDDRDRADELRGALICAKRGDFPKLAEDEFYVCDAEGAQVVCEGQVIGTVKDVRNYPTVDALVVKASDGGADWEIPLVDTFIASHDFAAGIVELRTLDGLER